MTATIVISAGLLVLLGLAIRSIIKSRKNSSCGCGCSSCQAAEQCHKE